MTKFKVGDRVKEIAFNDTEYTIVGVDLPAHRIQLTLYGNWYDADKFKLIEENTMKSDKKSFKIGDQVKLKNTTNHIIFTISKLYNHHDIQLANFIEVTGEHDLEYYELAYSPKFKAMKFRVNSEQEFVALQKYLFSLGYTWFGNKSVILRLHNFSNITTHSNGWIGTTNPYKNKEDNDVFFGNIDIKEYKFTIETTVTEIAPIEASKETITIDGKKYAKNDVINRLKELKELS